MPRGDTSLSDAEFSEAAASNLCLPSPACRGREVVIDEYGDNIQASVLAGDHYRTHHDALRHHVSDACRWAGLGCEVEVHNLFPRLIQQQGLSRAEKAGQFQGIVPDLRIKMPGVGRGQGQGAPGLPASGPAGQASSVLHEIKIISSSRTQYNPTWRKRAVDMQAEQLQEDYMTKARAADRRQNVAGAGVGTRCGHQQSPHCWIKC